MGLVLQMQIRTLTSVFILNIEVNLNLINHILLFIFLSNKSYIQFFGKFSLGFRNLFKVF